jgi:glycerol-3-phosphate dehydrogenase
LPIPSAVVLPEGKRILFAIPWCERVILGTTDTDYQGRIEDVVCEPADVEYILEVANLVFPEAKLTARDLISTWAGLRPLVANWRGKPSDISRAHVIRPTEPGWWDIAGGKLTTYRLMAEQMVDRLAKYLNRPTPPCRTASEPLLEPAEVAQLSGIAPPPSVGVAVVLPSQVRGVTEGGSTTAAPTSTVVSGIAPPPVSQTAVEHYCRREWAVHQQDVMIRRTSWHHYWPEAPQMATQVAGWMAGVLGWDAEQTAREIAAYQAICRTDRGCCGGTGPTQSAITQRP